MDKSLLTKPFQFIGKELTYSYLKSNLERVKVYVESSHKDVILMRDIKTEDLYLYDFDEFVTFDSRGDIMNELYVLVQNEADADQLSKQYNIKRSPYIWVQPDFTIRVY